MPKVSVYLPDDLYREAKKRNLPLSALIQQAVEEALRATDRQSWVAAARARPATCAEPIDTAALLDEVRAEFGT